MLGLRIGRKCVARGVHSPISSHISQKIHFHTSGPRHEQAGIPMPIGCRPRPNPDEPPLRMVLPPPVKYIKRTTATMEQSEAEEFLYPLYLRGWRVELIRTKDKSRRILTPFLTARFVLKDNATAREAVSAIHRVEEAEKHDASYEIFLKKESYIELNVRLQTHSARKWPPGLRYDTAPNVTLRDVRFAVLFERILEKNKFLLDQTLHQRIPPNQLLWDKILLWFSHAKTRRNASKSKQESTEQ